MKEWFWCSLGNIAYGLNGGLDGMGSGSVFERLMYYFWGKAYAEGDRKTGQKLKSPMTQVRR